MDRLNSLMDKFYSTKSKAQEIKRNMRNNINNPSIAVGSGYTPEREAIEDLCDLFDKLIDLIVPKTYNTTESPKSEATIVSENKGSKHGYWTGRVFIDDAHSEGFSYNMTEADKQLRREADAHATHCSVCGAMFDDRYIDGWKGCPRCLSILDLDRPSDSYFIPWESHSLYAEIMMKRAEAR